MRKILTKQNFEIIVDNSDFDFLSQYPIWKFGLYPFAPTLGYLHRFLAGAAPDKFVLFRNGNKLDLRRGNLKVVDRAKHAGANLPSSKEMSALKQALGPLPNNSTGFKGVHPCGDYFHAKVQHNGKRHYLGNFKTAEQAARAYDAYVRKHLGKGAYTNF